MSKRTPPTSPKALPVAPAGFRSAAVARMAQMPVATLRIWEQRYGAVQPATAASGHRRYSPADVQRVLLLRRLTEQGHAIGSIAMLKTADLLALTQGPPQPTRGVSTGLAAGRAVPAQSPLRVVVVGPALALRLQRAAVGAGLDRPLRVRAVFESLAEAIAHPQPADLLLWHTPVLHPAGSEATDALRRAQQACGAGAAAVVTRFAGSGTVQALAAAGWPVLHEPPDDDALGRWLASAAPPGRRASRGDAASRPPVAAAGAAGAAGVGGRRGARALAPRRFDDATLTALVGRLPNLACECPRHIAELLMQLAGFETYSAGCASCSPADAALHAYLHEVAGTARTLFESALERVAEHEGVALR
jgi:hypothetical protein